MCASATAVAVLLMIDVEFVRDGDVLVMHHEIGWCMVMIENYYDYCDAISTIGVNYILGYFFVVWTVATMALKIWSVSFE